jgi:hypothetical protein
MTAATASADLIRWFMKLLFLMELKAFDQARARAASVNRTRIRCRHAMNTTVLRQGQMADEKSQVFAIHHTIAASITTLRSLSGCDRKMCIPRNHRKMRRGGSISGNKPVASSQAHSVVIAIFAEHSTLVRSIIIIIPASHRTTGRSFRRL